ncbi:MAG: imidazole glycerol phosphate synthase subunit HisH [Steroidobacteraceae bacterium]
MNTTARVCVLDYGSGNVRSVANLLQYLRIEHVVSNSEAAIGAATHLVLPGVGAFGAAMDLIRSRIPLTAVQAAVHAERKPFLGICVGMQVLAESGAEFGTHRGLGWIAGRVRRFHDHGLPVPHVGWNEVRATGAGALLAEFRTMDFYFVHSYLFEAEDDADVVGTTTYGETFASVIRRDNIVGVQFHPEKSQKAGMMLLTNFLRL